MSAASRSIDTEAEKGSSESARARLLEEDQFDLGFETSQGLQKSRRSPLTSCKWLLIPLFLSCLLLVAVTFYAGAHVEKKPSCYCGPSLAEARAKGCKYDSLAAAWLPQVCRDDENTAEFERQGPGPDGTWIYYTDWDKTGVLTMDEVANLPASRGHFYTTHEWHVQHCLYIWRKIWRAPLTGVVIEGNIDTDGHLKHCGMMFMKRDPLDIVATGSGVTLDADYVAEH